MAIEDLRKEYEEIKGIENPQERGRKFENFLRKFLEFHECKSKEVKREGEQIDFTFNYGGKFFVGEVRWKKELTEPKEINDFLEKLRAIPPITYGFFISINGFTDNTKEKASEVNRDRFLALLDKTHLESILYEKIEFDEFFDILIRNVCDKREAYISIGIVEEEFKKEQEKTLPNFLKKIGYFEAEKFSKIDKIFVEPNGYEEIKETLENKKSVFLIGDAEIGKTYSAVKLLWEYYNRDYKPRYVKGEEEKQREDVRERLLYIESELKDKRVIYYEDPFGRYRYERRESLEREIETIIEKIQEKDVKVVISSRENVFKEFEKEKISTKEFEEFKKKLDLKTPSYDYEKRKEMLEKWAEDKDCVWIKDDYLKNLVFEKIKDESKLPTPLTIHDFVSVSANIKDENELLKMIENKSIGTAKEFAKEIKEMSEEKILFLGLVYVLGWGKKIEKVKKYYEDLCEKFGYNLIENPFKEIYKNENRIQISGGHFEFSHPSYEEGFKESLNYNKIKEFFSKLLREISKDEDVRRSIAYTIGDNIEKLDKEFAEGMLRELSRDKDLDVRRSVEYTIGDNFEKLDKEFAEGMLRELAKDGDWWVRRSVAWTIRNNFEKFNKEFAEGMLRELSKDREEWVRRSVAETIRNNFEKFNKEFAEGMLRELSKDKDRWVRIRVADAIGYNFEKLDKEFAEGMLRELAKDEDWWVRRSVACTIENNFKKFNKEFAEGMLRKLPKDEDWCVRGTCFRNIRIFH